jgi:hypothetical protein
VQRLASTDRNLTFAGKRGGIHKKAAIFISLP